MLSAYFPVWLLPFLSPAFNFINKGIPSAWRGAAMFFVCILATAGVVIGTPLGTTDLVPQAIILFGMVTAGYTITKPMETASAKVGAAALTLLLFFVAGAWLVGSASAQEGTSPVQAMAAFWLQIGLSTLNGVLGRLVKKIKA